MENVGIASDFRGSISRYKRHRTQFFLECLQLSQKAPGVLGGDQWWATTLLSMPPAFDFVVDGVAMVPVVRLRVSNGLITKKRLFVSVRSVSPVHSSLMAGVQVLAV